MSTLQRPGAPGGRTTAETPASPEPPATPGGPPRTRPPGRADASMSLLREAAERSLDPGYALAAAERAAREASGVREPDGTRRRRAALYGVLALLLGLAGAGAVADLRRPAPPEDRAQLLRQIEDRRADVDAAQVEVDALRADVDAQQARALGAEGDDVVERTQLLGVVAATAPVAGPGLRVTLDDAPGSRDVGVGDDPREVAESSEGLVLDQDLQMVANGLFGAGAEAVAINGQRLTSLAAIRVAGQAILVGFQPLTPPYSVEALGDPRPMAARFAASPAGTTLAALESQFGIQVASTAHEELRLPGGSAEVLRHARVLAPDGTAGGTVDPTTTSGGAQTAPGEEDPP